MKSALAGLVMIGTAGGLGMVLPSPSAPYLIGHATLPRSAEAGVADHVFTYAASKPMTRGEITAWANRFSLSRHGSAVVLIYPPGVPVPDPAGARNLRDALWIAGRGTPVWRIEARHGRAPSISRVAAEQTSPARRILPEPAGAF